MVRDVQPVPNIFPVAIDGDRFARQCTVDRQRDQLFGKLIRTVIIGAIRRHDRQAVGMDE